MFSPQTRTNRDRSRRRNAGSTALPTRWDTALTKHSPPRQKRSGAVRPLAAFLLVAAAACGARADTAPFDLTGPTLDVKVAHAGRTLPIAEVPTLSPGDQLWVKLDQTQASPERYVLVAAFLRGATNPPPKSWFFQDETWTDKGKDGLKITVPDGAAEAIVLLAPRTGGAFNTLVDAVRGRPGAFVRASLVLNEAASQRARLDVFLQAVRNGGTPDPEKLKTASPLLSRSLAMKLDPNCFQKAPELQAACLTQSQDTVLLSDGRSTSIVQALTSGTSADLAYQLGATPQARFGYFNPYISLVMDMARLMDSVHTAHFQYIPALATVKDEQIGLWLNSPPSFHDPMSVLVSSLPPIKPPEPPKLDPVEAGAVYCAERPDLILPVEGSPLVFSSRYAHEMVLRIKDAAGHVVDAPATADAEKGGFVIDTAALKGVRLRGPTEAVLHGDWGFEPFDGPTFHLQSAQLSAWRLGEEEQASLIVGRDDPVHLQGAPSDCVKGVTLVKASGQSEAVSWKAEKPDELSLTLPLANAPAGTMTLMISGYGAKEPGAIPLHAFAQSAKLSSFGFHVGDGQGVLKGSRLDEVTALKLGSTEFKPGQLSTVGGADELTMVTAATTPADLKPGQTLTAKVALKDGRTLKLPVPVLASRPTVALIAKTIRPPSATPVAVQLTNPDELPESGELTFSVHAQTPAAFPKSTRIEIATQDEASSVILADGSGLTFEDPTIAVATLKSKAFGSSVFGGLKFRVVEDGNASDWRPLATLVRLPLVNDLKCSEPAHRRCALRGSNLFLISSVSNEPDFGNAVKVPAGFTGYELNVPRPAAGKLYVKLHDNPDAVNLLTLPAS